MAKKKVCSFCGNEYRTDDKSVVLFRSSTDGSDIRICSECIQKCSELYNQRMAKMKQQALAGTVIDMTPKKIKEM